MNTESEPQTVRDRGTFQIVMDGHGPYSAPYTDREKAERRREELEVTHQDRSFSVETWPNHRQEDEDGDDR